ncbi:zonular occludens toxin domain-containing protein [Neisseria perflava]|uniref:zonular occludens toxin domain-containing protein n=1 Tax=Neisseria perflava TaxID=33053 RepID=UPI00209F2F81|nr:zonular occludens toxin domain-containing protein [Neisseria perflava]MCP1659532.1 zona occludens toxin [Neisseria perflava]MCP1773136.1 zona occludens toxin [Neisseria perflava]
MITLITGSPGSGKTLSMVSEIKNKIDKEWQGRKIFTDGIPELTIQTEPIPEGHSIHYMHVWLKWPENHGSIVIIDEAQRVFPPRSSNQKASELVEWMHIHRHAGADIYLITQMPTRIDKQVRDLVGVHWHIHQNRLGMRLKFYWDYCANNPKSESKNGQVSPYKFDKSVFGLYKSADVHTKIKKPKSRVLFIVPVAVVALAISSAFSLKLLKGNQSAPETVAEAKEDVKKGAEKGSAKAAESLASSLKKDENRSLTPEHFKPTIPDKVESKPIYDSVRQVKTFEYPVACVDSGAKCNCYTQQATIISEIDVKTCKQYVDKGLPFNPYKQPEQERYHANNGTNAVVSAQAQTQDNQVLVMGGQSQQNLMYDNRVPVDSYGTPTN